MMKGLSGLTGLSGLVKNSVASSPFSPTDISGLLVWFKGDGVAYQDSGGQTLAASDGDPVGAWVDYSGNERHATQGTSSKKPTLKLAIQNGLNIIRFDQVDDLLCTVAFGFPDRFTSFVVCQSWSVDNQCVLGVDNNGVARIFRCHYESANLHTAYGFNTVGGYSTDDRSFPDYQWVVLSVERNTGTIEAYVNGASNGPTSVDGSNPSTTRCVSLGGTEFNTNFLNGDIGEVLIYNTVISPTEHQQVVTYLRNRWGI